MLKKCTLLGAAFLLVLGIRFPSCAGEPTGTETFSQAAVRFYGQLPGGTPITHSLLALAFARFEAGETVRFTSLGEYYDFFEEYLTQYRLEDLRGGYALTGMELSIPEEKKYDREGVRQVILERFPMPPGLTPRQAVEEVCRQIPDAIRYDASAAGLTLEEALAAGQGVCWHYVKIADVILEQAGIPTEIVHGSVMGLPHMWIRCQTGNQSVLADPQVGILTASDYQSRYRPYPYLRILRQPSPP